MFSQTSNSCCINEFVVTNYEKIDFSRDLKEIFAILFTSFLDRVNGESCIIQVVSENKRKSYYGYHFSQGSVFWEPNIQKPCPTFMKEIVNAFISTDFFIDEKTCFSIMNILYYKLNQIDGGLGYLAVKFKTIDNQSTDEETEKFIRSFIKQIRNIVVRKRQYNHHFTLQKISFLRVILSSLLHDMKNPLSGISGLTQLINKKINDTMVDEFCHTILNSVTRVEKIVSNFLFYISEKQCFLEQKKICLFHLIQEITKRLIASYKHTGIDIIIEEDEDIWVMVDKNSISYAVNNILKNAHEAMPKGGSIHIKIIIIGSFAKLTIRDTGIGMPAHIQESIFKPFVTYGKVNSTGLGMTIAQKIINDHSGTIGVVSFLGKGTVFTINLPLVLKEA